MSFDPPQGGLDPYALKHIRFKARQLAGQAGFGAGERKDLEQELFLDLLQRLPQYDPDRARRTTFISRVVANRRTGAVSRPWEERQALAIDLAELMETLPSEWRMLCRRLGVETVSEISRDTGIARGTIYEWMGKLRAIFEEAGLREYLE